MESLLSQRLTQYFDNLLDNAASKTDNNKTDKRKGKNISQNGLQATASRSIKKKKKQTTVLEATDRNKIVIVENFDGRRTTKKTKDIHEGKPNKARTSGDRSTEEDKGFTKDCFKMVSCIPEDDSDVSDVFESCSEMEMEKVKKTVSKSRKGGKTISSNRPKKTEDGFKIVTEIPPDDSDVSDAFDEDEGDDFRDVLTPSNSPKKTEDGFKIMTGIPPDDSDVSDAFDEDKGDALVDKLTSLHQQKVIKKPILQIMNDFGIDEKVLTRKRENTQTDTAKLTKKQKKQKIKQANTVTQAAAKRKKQTDIQVVDYAHRRGGKKEKRSKEEEAEPSAVESKAETLDEKQLKRVRYDVFKLGMSGFHKEKKEDTRVALAIKLGAKPPRKKSVNYKTLQVMKKEEKKKETEEREMNLKLGLKVPKPFKKKEGPVVKASTSQVGRYKHGVQVLSKREIFKINKS